jgi:tRNA1Val (adenine37-N6)-methyltransferase
MKVGTDAVLLGAWCPVDNNIDTILDIGAGTGVLSLMLAQRSNASTIDAVEIESDAFEQATDNFEHSDWGDRLFCYHSSFDDFVNEMVYEEEQYDLIITNPPFYTAVFETDNIARNKARFTSSLSFESLLSGASKLLSKTGKFAVVIPYKEENNFINLALKEQLFLNAICRVKGTENSEIKRSLMTFSFSDTTIEEFLIVIENSRHVYSEDYINLTKDFYLKM